MKYVYSWTMDYGLLDPRDRGNMGGEVDTVTADNDEEALKKVRKKCGELAEIDWIYAVHHAVNIKKEEKR